MFQFVSKQTIIRPLLEELLVQVSSFRSLVTSRVRLKVYQGSRI